MLTALISKWGLTALVGIGGIAAVADPNVETSLQSLASALALLLATVILNLARSIKKAVPEVGDVPDLSNQVKILSDKVEDLHTKVNELANANP